MLKVQATDFAPSDELSVEAGQDGEVDGRRRRRWLVAVDADDLSSYFVRSRRGFAADRVRAQVIEKRTELLDVLDGECT